MRFALALVAGLWLCHRSPTVIHHPAPTGSLKPFSLPTGCVHRGTYDECGPGSAMHKVGCEQLHNPYPFLAALEPKRPIMVCVFGLYDPAVPYPEAPAKSEYLWAAGGLSFGYNRYVIEDGGGFRLIRNADDLRKEYAPITSPDEALAYVLTATRLQPRYDIETNRKYRYFTDRLEETYVQRVGDVYRVHLYDYILFGCGPHTWSTVEVEVTPAGEVRELSRSKAWEDPATDHLCVD